MVIPNVIHNLKEKISVAFFPFPCFSKADLETEGVKLP